ncbi:hypothetical protein [Sphingomonas insulae]|uniref:Uncharacterized protein n=1 Tax=Sphingomonas insulae TaxID=424800 RepID=A0ABN1I085_9SPHN|nr:hypothetical protein [Sphingomonas insulae]
MVTPVNNRWVRVEAMVKWVTRLVSRLAQPLLRDNARLRRSVALAALMAGFVAEKQPGPALSPGY